MKSFTNLHNHSHYSLLDGYSSIEAMVKAVKELGQTSLALTDHGTLSGIVKFYQECKKNEIKPILGCEIYLYNDSEDKEYSHMTVWCENQIGYNNLVKLSTKAYLEGFYKKPRVRWDWLLDNHEGLIIATGCLSGWIAKYWRNNNQQENPKVSELRDLIGDRLYFEIQSNSVQEQKKFNQFVMSLRNKYNGKLLTCCDSHYPRPEDFSTHDIITALRENKNLDDKTRELKHECNDYFIHSYDEVFNKLPVIEGLVSTQEIAERCTAGLTPQNLMPKIYNSSEEAKSILLTKVQKGFSDRVSSVTFNPEYLDRLDYELKVIDKLQFSDYFLIIEDIMSFCNKNGIRRGPGRGSGAGSLVCYVLGITDVDPIKYGLYFERFINPDRISPPDLDLDFDRDRREEVINYVIEKFGRDKVANIITFGTMQAKTAIKDVARTFGIDFGTSNIYTKLFDENDVSTIDEALQTKGPFKDRYEHDETFKKIVNTAKKLEGLVRQPGTHAAGIVIAPSVIGDLVPLHLNKKDNTITTQYSMEDVEYLGFLKMDFLGLRTLTVIENTLNRIDNKESVEKSMNKLDDKDVYKFLVSGKTSGVFQFEGTGITAVLKQVKPKCVEDLSAINALYRPGAMSGDMMNQYIRNRTAKKIKSIHPALDVILKETYGTLLYQESMMQMAVELAQFTGPQADTMRKAVAKLGKMGLLDDLKEKFVNGCLDNPKYKITKEEATNLFEIVRTGGYSFNKAHSLAYSIIGYQTAYLKYYYPTQYMTELLNSFIINTDKIAEYIKECKSLKISILPPDINKSNSNFFCEYRGTIRYGLNAIKSVNADAIIECRNNDGEFSSIDDFIVRISKIQKVNSKILIALIRSGALDSIHHNRKECELAVEEVLPKVKSSDNSISENQLSMFDESDVAMKISLPKSQDYENTEKVLLEFESFGFYLNKHPLERYIKDHGKNVAIIVDVRRIYDRKGKEMAFVQLETIDGKVEGAIFSDVYSRYAQSVNKNSFIKFQSKIDSRDADTYHIITSLQKIN